jgi:hypothetical protein
MDANGGKNNQNHKPRNKIMNAKPLSKEIYNKAKELGITKIFLRFSGGSDEGNLDIDMEPTYNQKFVHEIEDWAWKVYSYSGAGDGSDYGDNIEYDLKAGKVSTSEWYTSISDGDAYSSNLQIEA